MAIINGRGRVGARPSSGGGTPSYDADALAFFTAAGVTDVTQINAINTFFVTTKADGTYSKILQANLHFLGSSSKNRVNIVNPSNTISYSSGWSFNSNGATPNGTSSYISTGIFPNTTSFLQANSMHYSYYGRTNGTGGLIGGFSMGRAYIFPNIGGGGYFGMNTSYAYSGPTFNSQGMLIVNRNSDMVENLFKNGTILTTNPFIRDLSKDDGEILISAVSRWGAPFAGSYTNVPVSFSSVGLGFTDIEATNFSNAVNTMMTSLGINVY